MQQYLKVVAKFMKNIDIEEQMFTEDTILERREDMSESLKAMDLQEKDFFDDYTKRVDIQYEKVVVSDGAQIEIIIYKPKTMGKEPQAAYVYAHGGGAFAFQAREFNNIMSVTCINLNCIVVSVDFRNGPEVKCPRGQQDFADVVSHII